MAQTGLASFLSWIWSSLASICKGHNRKVHHDWWCSVNAPDALNQLNALKAGAYELLLRASVLELLETDYTNGQSLHPAHVAGVGCLGDTLWPAADTFFVVLVLLSQQVSQSPSAALTSVSMKHGPWKSLLLSPFLAKWSEACSGDAVVHLKRADAFFFFPLWSPMQKHYILISHLQFTLQSNFMHHRKKVDAIICSYSCSFNIASLYILGCLWNWCRWNSLPYTFGDVLIGCSIVLSIVLWRSCL